MTDAERLEELERQFGTVPISEEEGAHVEALSFGRRPLTRGTYKDVWKSFVEDLDVEHVGWRVHFGVAVWYWENDMRLMPPLCLNMSTVLCDKGMIMREK